MLLFVGAILTISALQFHFLNTITRKIVLNDARIYARTLEEFRALYTSEVVLRARKSGIKISHNYQESETDLPLPVTLALRLSQRIREEKIGREATLYSPYPFPWRRLDGGLNEPFKKEAWAALSKNPSEAFWKLDSIAGHDVLRYATADRMRSACISCHNSHPDSPKKDWKVGDLRGVLEIVLPIEETIAYAKNDLIKNVLYLLGILSIFFGALLVIAIRLRRMTVVLGAAVKEHKRLEMQVLRTAENEKQKISHQVHDGIGQSLTGITFMIANLKQSIVPNPKIERFNEVEDLLAQTLKSVRSLAQGLYPTDLASNGLVGAIQKFAQGSAVIHQRPCTVNFPRGQKSVAFDAFTSEQLYFIVQEAVTNAFKHGRCSWVQIDLDLDQARSIITVSDDGSGFAIDETNPGIGIQIMQYRARAIAWDLSIISNRDRGTAIECKTREPRTKIK